MSFYVMLLYNCGAKVQKKQKVIKGLKQKHKKIFLFHEQNREQRCYIGVDINLEYTIQT